MLHNWIIVEIIIFLFVDSVNGSLSIKTLVSILIRVMIYIWLWVNKINEDSRRLS